ncbi:hypothetical protein OS493_032062 [Desmophyllum pertusum]|uniref:TIR domain-containing protein n=1 Tax=Desmophyllum pertusum TaxID=174260 RepID=A0A9X0CPD7_9CNID|nr:hypothetical protein OS493_032062 [Desmophyllum pertusum]
MSTQKNNFRREPLVYVCGEASLNTPTDSSSLRDIVVRNLVISWAVRTHPINDTIDPRQDNAELFQKISHASVFVFIFSKKTLEDSYFLNQYGTAKSYNIPVVGVRLTNYLLRNPLPEQFYRTEIVDNSGGESNQEDKSTAAITTSLADYLIADFKTSMVYGPDFHKSCIERLTHKVAKAYSKSENERALLESSAENVPNISNGGSSPNKRNDKPNASTKCPKCGFIVTNFSPPKLQRASSTGSLLRRSNAFDQCGASTSNVKTTVPRNRTPLQPATIQIPSPHVVKQARKVENLPYGNWTIKFDNKKQLQVEPKIQPRAASVSSSESAREETKPPSPKPTANPKPVFPPNAKPVFRRQSRALNGSWTEKLRNKLRRQSSLPVIPTTYLVTTPDGFEKQISLVRYPPEKREPSSPGGSDG